MLDKLLGLTLSAELDISDAILSERVPMYDVNIIFHIPWRSAQQGTWRPSTWKQVARGLRSSSQGFGLGHGRRVGLARPWAATRRFDGDTGQDP